MRVLKISKELVSEVLNIPKESIMDIYTDGNYLLIRKINSRIEEYNIYGFAFKCKEWAFKQGYELFSRILSNDHQPVGNCIVYRVEADPEESLTIINGKTEQETIFKACEWILDNKA